MKLLQVHEHGCFKGGIERYLFDMTTVLSRQGIECHGLFDNVFNSVSSPFSAPFASITTSFATIDHSQLLDFKADGIHTVIIHKLTNLKLFKALSREFKTVVVIHDHDYYCFRSHKYFPFNRKNCHLRQNMFYCSLCSFCLRRKKGGLGIALINPLYQVRRLQIIKEADKLVVLSDFMRNNLLLNGVLADKIMKVYPFVRQENGSQNSESSPAKNPKTKLLYAGQLIRGKGIDLLLQSLVHVQGHYQLDIVGQGNDLNYLKSLAANLQLDQNIIFHGFSPDITTFYRETDIVVIPSRWQEPFGLVGLEAMAAAKPVIAFDTGGISEWLKDNRNGYLVPENDLVEFARRIDQLIDNRQLAIDLGKNGRELLQENFSESSFIESCNALWEPKNV